MDEINREVIRRLKARKDHEEVLSLWEDLWSHYEEGGEFGAKEFLEELLEEPD